MLTYISPESSVEEEEIPSKESEGGDDNIESERSPKIDELGMNERFQMVSNL